jgi:hypothetical protein
MPTDADPIVDTWYENQEESQQFKVVALDEVAGTVEIQHFDGDLEEIDLETWYLQNIEPMEDQGALDDYVEDSPGYSEDGTDDDWTASSQEINPSDRPSARASLDAPLGDWDEDLLDDDAMGNED